AQNGLDLNHAPPAHQEIQLDLNEPADPMEVIINPVNPNHNGDFLEINDLLEEIEEHIPQAQELAPQQNLLQEANQNMQVIGFPLPALPDVLGEEIPLDEIIGQNNNF
ncbi:hypothetical protein M3S_E04, partial [Sorghum bicolor]